MNKHHTASNRSIDDGIKGVEASLASKGNIGKEASGAGKHVEEVTIPENMQKWDYPSSDELYKKYENV